MAAHDDAHSDTDHHYRDDGDDHDAKERSSASPPAYFADRPPRRGPAVSPLPPLLTARTPGTWAHDTVSRRLRQDV